MNEGIHLDLDRSTVYQHNTRTYSTAYQYRAQFSPCHLVTRMVDTHDRKGDVECDVEAVVHGLLPELGHGKGLPLVLNDSVHDVSRQRAGKVVLHKHAHLQGAGCRV